MRRAFLRSRLDIARPVRMVGVLSAVAGVTQADARTLLAESDVAHAHALAAAGELEYAAALPGESAGTLPPDEGALLYALVRALSPTVVVETGTANGSSTLYFLAALRRNGHGRLISIDMPFVGSNLAPVVAGTSLKKRDSSPLPPGRESGWIVPTELRDRWELRLGNSRELLAEIGEPIDFFLHDSLHTREHMLAEFRAVWPKLTNFGLLASDDIYQRYHDALPAFAAEVGRPLHTFRKIGLIRR
jgi:predicted O-methyltransferase YrrM